MAIGTQLNADGKINLDSLGRRILTDGIEPCCCGENIEPPDSCCSYGGCCWSNKTILVVTWQLTIDTGSTLVPLSGTFTTNRLGNVPCPPNYGWGWWNDGWYQDVEPDEYGNPRQIYVSPWVGFADGHFNIQLHILLMWLFDVAQIVAYGDNLTSTIPIDMRDCCGDDTSQNIKIYTGPWWYANVIATGSIAVTVTVTNNGCCRCGTDETCIPTSDGSKQPCDNYCTEEQDDDCEES